MLAAGDHAQARRREYIEAQLADDSHETASLERAFARRGTRTLVSNALATLGAPNTRRAASPISLAK